MEDFEISKRLRAISMAKEWPDIIRKCYSHVDLRLWNKTLRGAHCEQRLGMPAADYYVGNALKAVFAQTRKWQYEKYDVVTQLVRIINSMISAEVRNYKAEQRQNRQLTLLIDNDEAFDKVGGVENGDEWVNDEVFHEQCERAMKKACDGNDDYKKFIELRKSGMPYPEIAETLECNIQEAYQMMETIGRRARNILKAEK